MIDHENLPENDEQVDQNNSDDDEVYNDDSDGDWISWFCNLEGNEFFVEIEENFVRNTINLYGLLKGYKNYKEYIEIILSQDSPTHFQSEEYCNCYVGIWKNLSIVEKFMDYYFLDS